MSGPADVLAVIGQLDTGGTERHLLNVFPELKRRSLDCRIYTLRGGGDYENDMQAAGVRVMSPSHGSRGWFGLLRTAFHFLRVLRVERPRIIHFYLPHAYLLGGLCSLFGPPCIRIMSRRSQNQYQSKWPFARSIEGFLHRKMDCILANSQALMEELLAEGVDEAIGGVIYNGVPIPPVLSSSAMIALRDELGIGQETFVVVMVANLIPYKGHADAIEALGSARDQLGTDWVVFMIGRDKGIQKELAVQAAATNIDSNIRWTGAVDDVQPYLAVADLAMMASHEEGFSNAILEAMAASVPVIATDVGGNSEAVVDQITGLLVPVNDPAAMSAAIIALFNDRARRIQLGHAAQAQVMEKFTLEKCVAAYSRVYQSLLAGDEQPIQDVIGVGR